MNQSQYAFSKIGQILAASSLALFTQMGCKEPKYYAPSVGEVDSGNASSVPQDGAASEDTPLAPTKDGSTQGSDGETTRDADSKSVDAAFEIDSRTDDAAIKLDTAVKDDAAVKLDAAIKEDAAVKEDASPCREGPPPTVVTCSNLEESVREWDPVTCFEKVTKTPCTGGKKCIETRAPLGLNTLEYEARCGTPLAGGVLTNNTTLTRDRSPYIGIEGQETQVGPGVTLSIPPGVAVYGAQIRVWGTLQVGTTTAGAERVTLQHSQLLFSEMEASPGSITIDNAIMTGINICPRRDDYREEYFYREPSFLLRHVVVKGHYRQQRFHQTRVFSTRRCNHVLGHAAGQHHDQEQYVLYNRYYLCPGHVRERRKGHTFRRQQLLEHDGRKRHSKDDRRPKRRSGTRYRDVQSFVDYPSPGNARS